MQAFVLMGVSGCGKTSVGEALAARTGVAFVDGDALHPAANIEKMSRGAPLNDADRAPWLRLVGAELGKADGPIAIGCSALKRSYRDMIRAGAGGAVGFLHLHADKAVLLERVNSRDGHFMPPSLLDSQFAALEPLEPDETGCVIDIAQPLEAVVRACQTYVEERI